MKQAIDNEPQPHTTVTPGDTLTAISEMFRQNLTTVENENSKQIPDPNLIYPGQQVKLPKPKLAEVVPPINNTQLKTIIEQYAYAETGQYYADHDPQAFPGISPSDRAEIWGGVTKATYNMLTSDNKSPYLDVAGQAEVKTLDALEPGNENFAAANQAAFAKADAKWKEMGVTKAQLSPIVQAYSNYKQAQALATNHHIPHNLAVSDDIQHGEQTARAALDAAIGKSLEDAAGGTLGGSKTNWVAFFKDVGSRAQNIATYGSPDHQFSSLVSQEATHYAANQAASSAAKAYGSGGIAGAEAAATQLANATQAATKAAAGDPSLALAIIQAANEPGSLGPNNSASILDGISKQLAQLATNSQPSGFGPSPAVASFNQIYGNLSQTVNAATPIEISPQNGKASITFGADGKTAADLVGGSIAANAPTNQGGFYEGAAENAIASGDGAGLSLATAAALKGQGNSNLASYVVQGAAQGFQGLKSKIDTDVGAFKTTNANLYQIQTTWTPFMTGNEVAKATAGYFADHKNVEQKSKAELATIGTDGDAIVEAVSAWHTYDSQLAGLGGPKNEGIFGTQTAGNGTKDLAAAAASLTGNDNAASFAVSQSGRLNLSIANTLYPVMEQLGGSGSSWQSWPGWSSVGSTRSILGATPKALSKEGGVLFPKGSLDGTIATRISLFGSVAGIGLTARNAVVSWPSTFSSAPDAVSSIYSGLGFGKYIGETISGLAKLGKLPNGLNYNNAGGSAAKFFFGENAADLTNSPAFKALGFFYYGAGAYVAGDAAFNAANNGNVETTLDAAEALGNAGNAAKPLLGLFTDLSEGALEEIGLASSGIGLLATAASLGWQLWGAAKQEAVNTTDNAKFLERGLGLAPDLAQALAAPVGSSPTLVPALEQYAKVNDMTPGELLRKLNHFAKLNRGYLTNINQFIFQASRMPMQSNGTFPSTAPGDGGNSSMGQTAIEDPTKTGQTDWVPKPLPAESLTQLRHWAQVLFGNQLG